MKTSAPTSTSNADWLVEVRVDGVPANCLVDTGASSTILSRSVWEQIGPGNKPLFPVKGERNLVDAQGSPLRLAGKGRMKLQLGKQVFSASVMVVETLTEDLILGRDFLKQHKCSVELGERNLLRLSEAGVTVVLGCSKETQEPSVAVVAENTCCARNIRNKASRKAEAPRQVEVVAYQSQQQIATVTKPAVTSHEQIPEARKLVATTKENMVTRKAKRGIDVNNRNRMVHKPRVNGSVKSVCHGLKKGKRKIDWRKMERKCHPPDTMEKE